MTSRVTRLHELHFRSDSESARPSSPQAEWVPPPAVSTVALVAIIAIISLTLAIAANFGLRPLLSEGPPAAPLGNHWQVDAEAMSAQPLRSMKALSRSDTGAAKPPAANGTPSQLPYPQSRGPTAMGVTNRGNLPLPKP